MALMNGVAFDGFPIRGWSIVEESAWFNVEVTFDTGEREDTYENWYFFKEFET